jgi:alanine-synthesizing transaminase
MFCWAKYPEPFASTLSSLDFSMKMLEEANVAMSPGSGFGAAGEGYVRMALVENENRLRQALRQIGRVLGQETKARPERVSA